MIAIACCYVGGDGAKDRGRASGTDRGEVAVGGEGVAWRCVASVAPHLEGLAGIAFSVEPKITPFGVRPPDQASRSMLRKGRGLGQAAAPHPQQEGREGAAASSGREALSLSATAGSGSRAAQAGSRNQICKMAGRGRKKCGDLSPDRVRPGGSDLPGIP